MISVLADSQIFHNLDRGSLQVLLHHAHRRSVPEQQVIVRQGDPALAFYIVAQGHAKIAQVTPDGHPVLIRYIGPSQEFGLVAVLSGFTYPASVQAVDACEMLVWEGELLAQLIERDSRIAFNAMRILSWQHQEQQLRYQALLTERVEQRLARSLIKLAKLVGRDSDDGTLIDLRLSREDLADLIGTTLFTVSRILSRWDLEGVVRAGRESVTILDMQSLVRVASST